MEARTRCLPAVCSPPAPDTNFEALQFEDFFTFRLSLLSDLLSRDGARNWFGGFGLTSPQRRLLLTVGRFPGCSFGELSRITQIDKGQVSRSARELQQRGLVRAGNDDRDARLKRLALTAEGERLHDAVFRAAQNRQADILSHLRSEEVRELYRLLAKLTACGMASQADNTRATEPERRTGAKQDDDSE